MKSVRFLSGFNAKLAVAACVVAGFSLAGCDEESFTVDVPNVEIPDVTFPEIQFPEGQPGAAYVLLSATSSTNEALNDVKFSIDGTEQIAIFALVAEGSHTITAEKAGYKTNSAEIVVPKLPDNAVLTIPVNVVLTVIGADDLEDFTFNVDLDQKGEPFSETNTQSMTPPPSGVFGAGDYTIDIPYPTQAPYLTNEQKEAFKAEVDKYLASYPASRATNELTEVRDLFYAEITNFRGKAETETFPLKFNINKPAESIEANITTDFVVVPLTISLRYKDNKYEVTSNGTCVDKVTVEVSADGIRVDHNGHSGHGIDQNAGGGGGE